MNIEVHHARADRPAEREEEEVLPGIGVPKALFFLAAFLSFVMSVYLFFTGDREQGIFVGLWVPSILSAGALLLGRNGDE
jgi:hypothetical protein